MSYKEDNAKGKSIVGKVENKKFAFFWLLIGGSVGNITLILYSFLSALPIFLPSVILSMIIALAIADKKQRPRIWLGIDLIATLVPMIIFAASVSQLAIFLPSALVIFGCVLGIMKW